MVDLGEEKFDFHFNTSLRRVITAAQSPYGDKWDNPMNCFQTAADNLEWMVPKEEREDMLFIPAASYSLATPSALVWAAIAGKRLTPEQNDYTRCRQLGVSQELAVRALDLGRELTNNIRDAMQEVIWDSKTHPISTVHCITLLLMNSISLYNPGGSIANRLPRASHLMSIIVSLAEALRHHETNHRYLRAFLTHEGGRIPPDLATTLIRTSPILADLGCTSRSYSNGGGVITFPQKDVLYIDIPDIGDTSYNIHLTTDRCRKRNSHSEIGDILDKILN